MAERSTSGQGQQCLIYVMGRADEHADSIVPSYGQISAGCGPNLREDFAETRWPMIVKVKPYVTENDLIQHLRDLADLIARHTEKKDMNLSLGQISARAAEEDYLALIDSMTNAGVDLGERVSDDNVVYLFGGEPAGNT